MYDTSEEVHALTLSLFLSQINNYDNIRLVIFFFILPLLFFCCWFFFFVFFFLVFGFCFVASDFLTTICHLAFVNVCVIIILSIGNTQISILLLRFLFVELMITINEFKKCLNHIRQQVLYS